MFIFLSSTFLVALIVPPPIRVYPILVPNLHTLTSGQNRQPDGSFDYSPRNFSPMMAPAQTFEHSLTEEAGEYPYFCLLHPNMVGTVSSVRAGFFHFSIFPSAKRPRPIHTFSLMFYYLS
jgi:hypothetical protein